ncbi:MAG TPA: apolipoprotein N-acyltransferase, partial [Treponemataceae bacterium]|nr:apolipoprotein N-acyltransferase [Treponemataceae bacterium]
KISYYDTIMIVILQVFYSFFSAFITSAAIPSEFLTFGSPFLGLFALVPLYLAISKSSSFKMAGFICSLQMGTVHLLTSFWLGNFKDFALFTLGASAAVYYIWGFFWGQLLYISFAYTKKFQLDLQSGKKQWIIPLRILSFAAVWTVYEWFKSIGFLAYPWGTILMSAYKWKLVSQICSITGVWGLSFLFALFSAVFAEGSLLLRLNPKQRYKSYACTAAFCMVLFSISTVYGVFQYTKNRIPEKTINAVFVQQNADSWTVDTKINLKNAINLSQSGLEKAIEINMDVDTFIWSESSLPHPLPESYNYYTRTPSDLSLIDFIAETNIPFIIGCPQTLDYKKKQYCNAVHLFSNKGIVVNWYGKVHLVPFAEGIPYADKKWMQALMQKFVGFSNTWSPGPSYTVFELPLQDGQTVNFTAPICFEDAISSICRKLWKEGSEVFINLTNDSWSLTKSAEYQHFVVASYRAIEMRTTLARSTNSGYSVVVDPAGRVLNSMPLFTATAKPMQIPIYERNYTVYCFLGDWLPILLLALWTITIFWLAYKQKNTLTQAKDNVTLQKKTKGNNNSKVDVL